MTPRWIPLFTVLALLAVSPAASAQPPEAPPHHDHHGPMEQLFHQLNLTPDQERKIRAIRDRHHQAMGATLEALHARRREFFALITQPNASQAVAIAKQREIDRLTATLGEERVKAWFESRQLLRPDQLRRLATLKPPQTGPGSGACSPDLRRD